MAALKILSQYSLGVVACVYKNFVNRVSINLYNECLTKEALDVLGDFNIGGQIIQTVKYADDLVLMAKKETVLQGMTDKLNPQ